MELDLSYEAWPCLTEVADTTLRREESQEAIVPDALPDIGTVLSAAATPMIERYLITGGTLHCDGTIAADVVYQAEGEEAFYSLHVALPVRLSSEIAGLDEGCRVQLCCCLDGLSIRVMNPRKVLVNGDFVVQAAVYRGGEIRYSTGIETAAEGIQTRVERQMLQFAAVQTEKQFPIEDEITLGVGRLPMESLLSLRAIPYCSECRIVGARMIFKGCLQLECRFRREDGVLECQNLEVPLSQVLDAGQAGEDATAQVRLSLTSLQVELVNGDRLAIQGEVLASALVFDTRTVSLLTDAYSTNAASQVAAERGEGLRLTETSNLTMPFRQVLDVETLNAEVLDQQVMMTECAPSAQGGVICRLRIMAVLRDENSAMTRVERVCEIPLELDGAVRAGDIHLLEATCLAAAGGMEVRGKLHLDRIRAEKVPYTCLSSFTLTEGETAAGEGQPSAVLRKLRTGESLWDVAKACYATVEDILSVNQIGDEAQAREKFLLIPRKR
ncbi:MAG: DUF3794 domain-containing protein [Oscillospiraceae bacterium]|nr:DUF3794 domain-containing protein [Oscillospiraceae bacterium]